MNRRGFLQASAAWFGSAVVAARRAPGQQATAPNDRIVVAVMGARGRGGALLATFAAQQDVDLRYLCDLDLSVLASRVKQAESITGKAPEATTDYRRVLDDAAVDALVIGTPDHWHALPAIHACQAGKDVYVEKPDGHNIREGQTMVAAARKYQRVVQLGTQARSGPMHAKVMRYLGEGNLGQVRFAKAWESSRQASIGRPSDSDPPPGFDYDTWLGPAPKRPFNIRRWHGSWRWFFDYGTGDLGNDGVHRIDVARWALETALDAQAPPKQSSSGQVPSRAHIGHSGRLPKAVSAHGGLHYFDDMQQWPDTLMVSYDYDDALLAYEMRIWTPYRLHGESEGAAVYGDQGYVVIGNRRWRAFDAQGKQILEEGGSDNTLNTQAHVRDFLTCMRTRGRPQADLATVGHPSSILCHLGNAAWRAGRTLNFDPHSYRFQGDERANQLLTRAEYRKPWLLPELATL